MINFNENHKEDNMGFIYREEKTDFEIFGTSVYNNNFYVRVIKNGFIDFKTKEMNQNMIQCRISLIKPEYIYCDEPLNDKEKQWFIKGITEMWNYIIHRSKEYNKWWKTNYKLPDQIPDYSLL